MSKKILKRSLALGALMAFVITGSAFADGNHSLDHVFDHEQHSHFSGLGSETIKVFFEKGLQEDIQLDRDPISYGVHCGKGCVEWEYNTADPNAPDTYLFELNDNTLKINGGIHVGAKDKFEITGATGSALYLNGNLGVAGTVAIDTLNIKNGSLWTFGSKMEVTTQSLVINYDDPVLGIGINANGEPGGITINTKDLTVNGAAGAITSAWKNAVNITADKVNIANGKEGILACLDSSIDLKATQGVIESNVYAGGYYGGKGIVNLTLGEGVNWTGKIITDVTDFGDKDSSATLDLSGTWNLKDVDKGDVNVSGKANSLTNATFRKGSTFVIDGATYVNNDGKNESYALNGAGDKATLTVENGAKLTVTGIDYNTYNIAKDFATISKDKWQVNDLNTLMEGKWVEDTENKTLQLEVVAKNTSDMATETGISTSTAGLVQGIIDGANSDPQAKVEGTPQYAAAKFIESVLENNPTDAAVGNAINNATKMGEAGGNSATAASIVKNVTGVTNDRLSFNCGHSAPHKGGHGVGLFEEGSGADVWVEYVHGKDEVEDMPSTAGASSYEGQYNGIVMGVDFKKVNKFQSGIAFNYGEGDTNSVGNAVRTHSDYDFWGVGYYGSIHNDDSNVIFDISYAQTDSDVTQNNSGTAFEANPETTTWSAGVKLEKLYQNENVQIVPYTGLRYMSIDADDYSTRNGEFYYSMDRQDIWLLPLGVSIRQEIANDNGWTVSPRVDLSYIWAFGDTNSNMEVKSPFAGVSQLGYDVMDDGSFLGLVGIEAHKGQWGYGVAYSYQKGDHSESKKWYVDVNYSF